MVAREGEHIPALMKQPEGIGCHRLVVGWSAEALIRHLHLVIRADGTDDGVEEDFAGRDLLQHDAVLHGNAVCQDAVHRERGEEPARNGTVAQVVGVLDVVAIVAQVAGNVDAEHLQDGLPVAVEGRTLQHTAVGDALLHPQAVQLLKGETLMTQRVDDPDVLMKNASGFHEGKGTKIFRKKERKTKKCSCKLRKLQVMTAQIVKSLIICKKGLNLQVICAKKKRKKGRLPRTP